MERHDVEGMMRQVDPDLIALLPNGASRKTNERWLAEARAEAIAQNAAETVTIRSRCKWPMIRIEAPILPDGSLGVERVRTIG
jgi:hypothetical protein